MKLDYRQTRRLYLAGTVAFPSPYPSCGIISFESGNSQYAAIEPAKGKVWVIVQQYSDPDWIMDSRNSTRRHCGDLYSWDSEVEWRIPNFPQGSG